MNAHKMHESFRTLGQQMGMQMIRAILPETIDVHINSESITMVRDYVNDNVRTDTRGRVVTNPQITPINSLRTLFKKETIDVGGKAPTSDFYEVPMTVKNVCFYTSFAVKYDNGKTKGFRFIEGDELPNTLDDYCNGASWDYPIITMFADNDNKEITELYINSQVRIPNEIYVRYIELPSIVEWKPLLEDCKNSNLPEHMHVQLIKNAVASFLKSISTASQS